MNLGELFVQAGLVSHEQLRDALQKQQEGIPLPLDRLLVQLGYITEKDRARSGTTLGYPFC